MENESHQLKKQAPGKQKIGEILVKSGLINTSQLQQVLKRQTQVGGHLGSILIEMGFITINDLIHCLSKKLGVPAVNLFDQDIKPELLNLLPVEKMKTMKILPISLNATTVTVAMSNPQDFMTVSEIEFVLGRKISPVVVPSFMIDAALNCLPLKPGQALKGEAISRTCETETAKVKEVLDLESLLEKLMQYNASDVLLTPGAPPSIRVDNALIRVALPALLPVNCEMYAREIIPYSDWDEFLRNNEHDLAASFKNIGRFRVNIYRQRNSISIAMRPIKDGIPGFKELNLPEWLKDFAFKPQGLILVSGPAGHGKTTTLSALIDVINSNQQRNIITLEDPIEVMHKHRKSNINQREVGTDTESFASGLRTVFRQSPDVIVVGEMRDKETFEIGLQAADTGHLVMSSVHANNTTSIFDRVINMFEPHMQPLIRTKLADCLQLVLSQRLIPLKNGGGRILAIEKLINSYRIKKFIKDSLTNRIRSQMQAGTEEFESIDMAVAKLYNRGLIAFNDGLMYVEDEQYYRELTGAEK
jgi:twitching motility protein PilT